MGILIESKFNGSCKTCKGRVAKGARVYWTPGEKGVVHPVCPVDEVQTDPIKVAPKFSLGDFSKVDGFETLYEHQAETVNAVRQGVNRLYLGFQPGLGKTATSLAAAEVGDNYPLIIVCPSVVKINWQREVRHWLGKEAQVLSSRTPTDITSDIVIINYEVLSYWLDALAAIKPRGLVFDESHYIKNPDSARTKAAKALAAKIKSKDMIFMLSGTPTPNSVYDLVQPLTILGAMKAFGGQRKYIKRYCPPVQTQYGTSYARARHLDELHTNLKNSCLIRRTKEDCLDLPAKIRVDIPIEVKINVDDFYSPYLAQMRKPTMAEAKRIAATITNDQKKGQIMAERAAAGTAKISAIVEHALDIDGPLIVMVHHKDVQKEVFDRLKKKRSVSLLSGGMQPAKRQAAIDDFQNGVSDIIVCSITAAGVGINLQRAESMILGELPLTYAEVDQAESRAHRSGQRNVLTVYRMIGLGTSDETVMGMINRKEAVSAAVEDGQTVDVVTANDLIATRLLELYKLR